MFPEKGGQTSPTPPTNFTEGVPPPPPPPPPPPGSDSGSAPPVYSKCYKRPKRGIETKHFAKFLRIRGSKYDISIFFSHTGVKLYQFSKDLKGGQNCRISRTVIYSQYPPRGCLSIFWKGYWVYGVLFRVPRVLYRNLSVVWIWKLSVLVMWCKLVKTFRSERLP